MSRTRTLSLIVRFVAFAFVLGGARTALAQSPADDWARAEEVVRAIRLPEIPARDYPDYPGQLGGNYPSTYRDIVFENFTVERAGTVFDGDAPAAAPLRDVTLRNVRIKQADRTFILKNVEGLKLENVHIGGQRVDGQLEWRQAATQP